MQWQWNNRIDIVKPARLPDRFSSHSSKIITYFFITRIFKLVKQLLQNRILRKIKKAHGAHQRDPSVKYFFYGIAGMQFKTGKRKLVCAFKAQQLLCAHQVVSATHTG